MAKIFYSDSRKGFFHSQLHTVFPEDSIEVTEAEYEALLIGKANGGDIAIEAGKPTVIARNDPIVYTATPYQLRQALNLQNLRGQVESYIRTANQETQDAWQFSQAFHSNHSRIKSMANTLGLSPTQVDELFQLAVTLEP